MSTLFILCIIIVLALWHHHEEVPIDLILITLSLCTTIAAEDGADKATNATPFSIILVEFILGVELGL